jgi:hypothetical protein
MPTYLLTTTAISTSEDPTTPVVIQKLKNHNGCANASTFGVHFFSAAVQSSTTVMGDEAAGSGVVLIKSRWPSRATSYG